MKLVDIRKFGRSAAFAQIKEPGPGLLRSCVQTRQWTCSIHIPPSYGLMTLKLPDRANLDFMSNLVVDSHLVQVVQWDPPFLEAMIPDNGEQFRTDPVLEQRQTTALPEQVAQELDAHWRQYWDRDRPVEPPDAEWQPLLRLFEEVPQRPEMHFELQNLDHWTAGIKSLKSRTARGSCGWAADELKMLPEICVKNLIDAFLQLGNKGIPTIHMAARTIPLLKQPSAMEPANTRPITILALLYRLWGRVCSQIILKHWSVFFPPAITGFLPHRSATMPMYQLQHILEMARHSEELIWSGLTLDLKKCFNCLPLYPSCVILIRLGVPSGIVEFWYNTISELQRHWQIGHDLYNTGKVTTGAPEGDAFSVLLMLAYNYLWTTQCHKPTAILSAYADNWSYATQCLQDHQDILQFILRLTAAMKLQIDWSKTWIWTTTDQLKPALKALLQHLLPPDIELSCVSHAKDLGFILHYRCRQFRKPQMARHEAALARLKRLKKSAQDLDTKAVIAQAACVTKALYGTHCYVASESTLAQLRSALADVLVGDHRNVNPYLACTVLTKHVIDPELYVIKQALVFAREFLVQASEATRHEFLQVVASPHHRSVTVMGPAGALAIYLARVGWKLTRHGVLLVDAFFELHLIHSPLEDILEALHQAWMEHVAIQVSSRKGYKGMPIIDVFATHQMMAQLPDRTKNIAAVVLTGGYMLQQQKHKFDSDVPDICQYCEEDVDSHTRRLLQCPLTAPVRLQFPEVCQFLEDHDIIHQLCPAHFQDPNFGMYRQLRHTMPEPPIILPADDAPMYIFTDGSCSLPEWPQYRYATYSAVCFRSTHLALNEMALAKLPDIFDSCFHVLCASFVTGRHTIARAELMVVILLLEHQVRATYVTDSQYVITSKALILQNEDPTVLHRKPNSDLLLRWHFQYWQRHFDVPLVKVKSHDPIYPTLPDATLFERLGNAAADHAAKEAAKNMLKPFTADMRQMAADARKLALC